MAEKVYLFRRRTRSLEPEQLQALSEYLEIKGEPVKTDEALALRGENRALVYAQPCARLAGQLFYVDQSTAWGEVIDKPVDEKHALDWSHKLIEAAGLQPDPSRDEDQRLEFDLVSFPTEGVVFDGKERRRVKVATNVRSQIRLNEIPVVGPRGKVRMLFKGVRTPVMMLVGLWDRLEVYEERDLVSENEVARAVQDRLTDRKACGERTYNLNDIRLVYFAGEYEGGPDLLAPEYHVEVEHRDPAYRGKDPIQGPRQVIRLPAYR